ncbi:DUF4825 domain-containing protein [Psychrobacillus sp. FSL K6-2684]|uniref:DUF4825 domain-containing protein n=1 Tax=unclassified Psychrobacillus TaxID=2636677 RepID=UPI001246C7CC|nr:DUF4825 domain-containing protein [Psychrobacillus sp. AK 1817]QEY19558.1 DUF4825 domain-containing protein [Psychrobacillus sp. AK 1817]
MKNKIIIVLFIIGIILFGWMNLFYIPAEEKAMEEETIQQLNPETHDFSKVLAYENRYMGNLTNNAKLFQSLPLQNYLNGYEQDSKIHLLIVNYKDLEGLPQQHIQKSIIYNTTAAFVLIKNLEQIELRFPTESFFVKRENVERVLGDLEVLLDPEVFEEQVQSPLNNAVLEEWIVQYTSI